MAGDNHQAQFPRLAISDLVVLTLSVAVAFACVAPNYQHALRQNQVTAWQVIPDLLDYLSYGMLLFGLIVLGRQRIRGSKYSHSPGQLLVLVLGPYSVFALVAIPIRSFLWGRLPSTQPLIRAGDNVFLLQSLSLPSG